MGFPSDFELLLQEHRALMQAYGRAQISSSELLRTQAREIERLNANVVQLRAVAIVRDTALAWARADRAALEQAIPGLPRRVTLARRVDELLARIQQLMRERLHWQFAEKTTDSAFAPAPSGLPSMAGVGSAEGAENLEASLGAADLVICQTGCLSHGDYWRVQDHCKRTGKTCVTVEKPESLRIVHIHRTAEDSGRTRIAPLLPQTPE